MTNIDVSSSSPSVYTAPLIPFSKYSDDVQIKAQIQEIINIALACPTLKKLAKKSCQEGDPLKGKKGPLEIIYDPNGCKMMRSTGFTDYTNRYIVLSTLDPVQALAILILEVGNASQTAEYRYAQEQIKKGTITCDAYVKAVEKIEHTSSLIHHKIVQWGMNHLNWSQNLDVFKHCREEDFERTWHQRIRFSAHAQLYREQYAMITKTDTTMPGWQEKIDSIVRVLMYLIRDLCHGIADRCQRMIKKT